ncbi:MAG: sensor domain-containing diguanylate cyclase [Sulfurimonas sp.]|nr:sensor domain-containing diguanylate cyclase [Sulfurimonas sp.]
MFRIFILLLMGYALANANTLILDPEKQTHQANGYLEVLHDPKGTLNFPDVMQHSFESLKGEASFGFTTDTIWLRFNLRTLATTQPWLLEIALSSLDDIELYTPQKDGNYTKQHSGDHYRFEERPVRHRLFVFPLELAAQEETTIYLRIQTLDSFVVPIRFWTRSQFELRQQNEYLLLGISYGIMIAMLIYNLFLWLVLRERLYVYYLFSSLALLLVSAELNGHAFEFLWPNNLWMADNQHVLIPAFHFIALTLWVRVFLQTKKRMPRLDWALLGIIIASLLLVGIDLAGSYPLANQLIFIVGLAMIFSILIISIRSVVVKYPSSNIFLLAQIFPLIGGVFTVLRAMGIIDDLLTAEHALQIGITIEVLIFSLALARRIRLLNEEKQQARIEAESDFLTGLYNRTGFFRQTREMMEMQSRSPFALLLIDLDKFKFVNDQLGHAAGDSVLCDVAGRLRSQLRMSSDIICRYGGDEFVVVLPGIESVNVAGEVAQKIVDVLNLPFETVLGRANISASIGVALYPHNGQTLDTLLQHADASMYLVKNNGANGWLCASPELIKSSNEASK